MPDGHPTLLVGTTKGAFLIVGRGDHDDRAVKAPFRDGWPINHVVGDNPETGSLWAAGGGDWNGAGVWRSGNARDTWRVVRLTVSPHAPWTGSEASLVGTRNSMRYTQFFVAQNVETCAYTGKLRVSPYAQFGEPVWHGAFATGASSQSRKQCGATPKA